MRLKRRNFFQASAGVFGLFHKEHLEEQLPALEKRAPIISAALTLNLSELVQLADDFRDLQETFALGLESHLPRRTEESPGTGGPVLKSPPSPQWRSRLSMVELCGCCPMLDGPGFGSANAESLGRGLAGDNAAVTRKLDNADHRAGNPIPGNNLRSLQVADKQSQSQHGQEGDCQADLFVAERRGSAGGAVFLDGSCSKRGHGWLKAGKGEASRSAPPPNVAPGRSPPVPGSPPITAMWTAKKNGDGPAPSQQAMQLAETEQPRPAGAVPGPEGAVP